VFLLQDLVLGPDFVLSAGLLFLLNQTVFVVLLVIC
jgi:hypothetical protein